MRDLSRLFSPKSIAVVGGGAWCANVIQTTRQFGFEGELWAVHPTRAEIAGVPVWPDVAALPAAPDAAFVGVNHAATVEVVSALARRGAGGAVAFASGFGEVADPSAADRQANLVASAAEMPVLGPNCYGFVNALDRVALWPDQHGLAPVERGVAIVTQSSNIAINMTMQARGLPIAAIVTAGNQAQLGLSDLGLALIADPRVTALGLHIEGLGDVRAFERMVAAAHDLGKPVVVLKAGRSEAAQAATLSHTASLAGSQAGASALFARLGCAEASGLGDFLETLKVVHVLGPLPGSTLASMSCSGGEASLIADAAERIGGLDWAVLTDTQTQALAQALGPRVTLANPLDYHTYIWNDVPAMTQAYAAMLAGPQDLTCLVIDSPRADRCDPSDWDLALEAAVAAQRQTGGRLALIATLPEAMPETVATKMAEHGIVTLSGLDDGLRAIGLAATPGLGHRTAVPDVLLAPEPRDITLLSESDGKVWLSAVGVAVPQSRVVTQDGFTTADLKELLSPFVVKALGLAHKTEAGAVALGLADDAAIRAAMAAMPGERFLVEEQIDGALVEILIGVLRDPAHGFVLTLGAGGVMTEILRDTVSLLVPSGREDVDVALNSLKIAPVLDGYRGKPAAARAALLDAIMAVQAAVMAEAATLTEVEINPLIVTASRAVAVDALIRKGHAR